VPDGPLDQGPAGAPDSPTPDGLTAHSHSTTLPRRAQTPSGEEMPRVASLIRLSGSEPAVSSAPRAAITTACLVLLALAAAPLPALAASPSGPSPDPAPARSGPMPAPAPVSRAPAPSRPAAQVTAPAGPSPTAGAVVSGGAPAAAAPAHAAVAARHRRARRAARRHPARHAAAAGVVRHRAIAPVSVTASRLPSVSDATRDTSGPLARGALALLVLALAGAALLDRLRRDPRGQRERW